ncbi:MAG TPA: TatD family hydrolase, partial [Candidatus Brocadiia bacterium]|nr:TatD family hydrolase [Candidatus Brocadiia bacterium]
MLVDTHAHLDDPKLLGRVSEVLDNARAVGVERVISVGIDEATSATAIELAGRFDMVKATVGVHPHEGARVDDGVMKRLEEMARQPNVVAVGETGLDYYRDRSPREAQRRA